MRPPAFSGDVTLQPKMIDAYEFLLVGLEAETAAATTAADTIELNNRAEALGLVGAIPHAPSRTRYVSLVWDWSDTEPFNVMVALGVTRIEALPEGATARRFPSCDFAVFPMTGHMPSIVEPWEAIADWCPKGKPVNTMMLRRYDEALRTGEVWIPMQPNLQPLDRPT